MGPAFNTDNIGYVTDEPSHDHDHEHHTCVRLFRSKPSRRCGAKDTTRKTRQVYYSGRKAVRAAQDQDTYLGNQPYPNKLRPADKNSYDHYNISIILDFTLLPTHSPTHPPTQTYPDLPP